MMELMMILEHSIRKQIKEKDSTGAPQVSSTKTKKSKKENATTVHYLAQQ